MYLTIIGGNIILHNLTFALFTVVERSVFLVWSWKLSQKWIHSFSALSPVPFTLGRRGRVILLYKWPDLLYFTGVNGFLPPHPTYIFAIQFLRRANLSQDAHCKVHNRACLTPYYGQSLKRDTTWIRRDLHVGKRWRHWAVFFRDCCLVARACCIEWVVSQ